MRFIGAGFRTLVMALINGDPLWPAMTLFLVSLLIAIVVAAVRASHGGRGRPLSGSAAPQALRRLDGRERG